MPYLYSIPDKYIEVMSSMYENNIAACYGEKWYGKKWKFLTIPLPYISYHTFQCMGRYEVSSWLRAKSEV